MNNMDFGTRCLYQLVHFEGLKITSTGTGTIKVEVPGFVCDVDHYCIQDALFNALIQISAHLQAKNLVMNAKITL